MLVSREIIDIVQDQTCDLHEYLRLVSGFQCGEVSNKALSKLEKLGAGSAFEIYAYVWQLFQWLCGMVGGLEQKSHQILVFHTLFQWFVT